MTGLLLAAALALPAVSSSARAEVRRVAVVAANNEGSVVYRSLFFAEDDAEKIEELLVSVGGYDQADVDLVLGATRGRVQDAFADARRTVAAAHRDGDQVIFLFYWSGHGDEQSLLLGDSTISYDELEGLLAQTGADVKLAFLDACNSGAATRSKGGSRVPAFDIELAERLGASGTVIITSSSGDEASQESDEIGGSYFTHYLASGLYGAADEDGDATVTLSEAYAYVYNETVLRTSTTRIGTQHPSYEWDLSGEGDLVLAELDPARGTLVFGPELDGSFAIFDTQRRVYVAEVGAAASSGTARARRIHLAPGRYEVRRRLPTHLRVADVAISDGAQVDIAALDFRPVEYEDDVAKGAIEDRIRQARMPDSSVRVGLGVLGADGKRISDEYLPAIPVVSASWRLNWHDGRWLSVDLSGGAGDGSFTVGSEIPATLGAGSVGVGAGYATLPRLFQAGIGLRADTLVLARAFDPTQGVPDQSLVTVAPGVDAWAGLHHRRFEAELQWRHLLVPTSLDDIGPVFTMHQAQVVMGYRF